MPSSSLLSPTAASPYLKADPPSSTTSPRPQIANNAAIAAAKRSASPADKKQQAAPKKVRRASTNAGQKIAGASRAYEGEFNDYIQPPPPPSANPMRASTGASAAQPKKKGKTASMSGSLPPSGSPGIGPGGMMAGMPMGGPLSGQMGGSMHMQQLQQQQMQLLQQMQAMQNGGGAMGMGMNGPPSGGDVNALQLKFCKEVLKELFKKQHESFAYPFYDPVGEWCLQPSYCIRLVTAAADRWLNASSLACAPSQTMSLSVFRTIRKSSVARWTSGR